MAKIEEIISSSKMSTELEPLDIKTTFTHLDETIFAFIKLTNIEPLSKIDVKWFDANNQELISLQYKFNEASKEEVIINHTHFESFINLHPSDFGIWCIKVYDNNHEIGNHSITVKNFITYSPKGINNG